MMASVGASDGLVVPPDYVAKLIEVLRPMTVVRDSGPRVLAIARGTTQMPRQNQAATASYGGETQAMPVSQQAVGQIVATCKELAAPTNAGHQRSAAIQPTRKWMKSCATIWRR
jgi:HK97 family phage major capsid protein